MIELEPGLRGQDLSASLAEQTRNLGLQPPLAFVWGELRPVPDAARPARIRAGAAFVDGWLVEAAHQVDMGKLAPEIRNVVMVSVDGAELVASHPSGPGRHPIDLDAHDDEARREQRELFAFVSAEPDDLRGRATAAEVVALWSKLPDSVRYAVLPVPG